MINQTDESSIEKQSEESAVDRPSRLPYSTFIHDPDTSFDYIRARFRESLQFEHYTDLQITDMVTGMHRLTGWGDAYRAIQRMLVYEMIPSRISSPHKIVNIFVCPFDRHQRHRQPSTKYRRGMADQRLLFLVNQPDELAANLSRGVSKSAAGRRVDLGPGFYFTEQIQAAMRPWIRNDQLNYKRRVFVPVAAVALGNSRTLRQLPAAGSGVPSGFDSVSLTGVWGSPYYQFVEHQGIRFRHQVDGVQLNRRRIQELPFSGYFVQDPRQVRIAFLIELEWCDKRKRSWFDDEPAADQ